MNCTVCQHPQRELIDRALLAGASQKMLAWRHGLSAAALSRHKKHLLADWQGRQDAADGLDARLAVGL